MSNSDRAWQPGDVAMVNGRVCLKVNGNWEHGDERAFPYRDDDPALEVRPLVVIDPEDREQVDRLRAALDGMSFSTWACGALACLQSALRELASPAPPRPEEPTGLGAVVEDSAGEKWVRRRSSRGTWCPERGSGFYDWSNINAVRVLSEGVQP